MEGLGIFLVVGAIVVFLIWLFKWLPEGNKNKMNKFVNMLNDLDGSFTKEMVMKYLPYQPTYITENTLQYNISRVTSSSFGGNYVSSETSSFHFELIFINNHLSVIYRILPSGEKIIFKVF